MSLSNVVGDTGPLHYLTLIGQPEVMAQLFGTVAIPATVASELRHERTPIAVRSWATLPPRWIIVHDDPAELDAVQQLDPGERAAISLASRLGSELLLLDDRLAAAVARALGFRVTGTIGVLVDAARHRLIDLEQEFARLRATNFRYPPALLDRLLEEHRQGSTT